MTLTKPVAVDYNSVLKEITVRFADGSKSSWPVRLLEMVRYDGSEWVSIQPTEEELAKVELWGEDSIQWDELDQVFRIQDLRNGIYGRKAWMQQLSVMA